jgi:hypothetical protein
MGIVFPFNSPGLNSPFGLLNASTKVGFSPILDFAEHAQADGENFKICFQNHTEIPKIALIMQIFAGNM